MSYISADDYEPATQITELPYNDSGANCNSGENCPSGYNCVNNLCSAPVGNPAPVIPFRVTIKKIILNNNVWDVPIGVPLPTNNNNSNMYSLSSSGNLFEACNVDSDCVAGYWCLNTPPQMTGINSPTVCLSSGKGNMGAGCNDGRDCLVGLDCYNSSTNSDGSKNRQCLMEDPNPAKLPTGATCASSNQCNSNICNNHMCEPIPLLQTGSSCSDNTQCYSNKCTNLICE